ncbi:phiSA1p31-related protein [Streptomyces cyaneofuscatus]|uniref:phiSA1p31-related protein n=1 Tax=Streptomyces cyaneofuscatus TaxID=66883 RepID=UPI00342FC94B
MTEFKVGDKAIRHGSEVEITYGPFTGPLGFAWLVVRREDGKEDTARVTDLSPVPVKFAVGDKVTAASGVNEYTLHAGPFNGGLGGHFWVLERPDGTHCWAHADSLTKVEAPALVPVGTRVRVDRAKWAEEQHGETGVIRSNTETWTPRDDVAHVYEVELDNGGSIAAAEVTPVDDEPADGFEYEGVTYKYGVPYTDCDGDTWTFERPTRAGAAPKSDSSSYRIGESLVYIVDNYRPLTTD